jgi:hypothetical protein
MRHPAEGVLRRLLDEPAGVIDADRRHVAGCEECRQDLAAVRHDADRAEAVMAPGTAVVELDAAWERLMAAASTAEAAGAPAPRHPAPRRAARARPGLRRPVVAGVAVAAVLVGAGAAAAGDWLQIFRTERIAPVSLSTADLNAVPDLEDYGDVVVSGEPDVHEVADAAAAAAETGLDVPEAPDLPRGVSGEPTYQVGGEVSVTFTYSEDEAARAAAVADRPPPPAPPGVDGSRVRLVAGPGVAAIWSESVGGPDLVVGRAVAPRGFSDSGVPFEVLRDHLLSLPGLPEDVAASLRGFGDDDSTLPLPVPTPHVTTSSAEVDGAPATVFATRDRSLAAVTWVEDGVMTVVAGPLDTDEVLAVAGSLR